MQGLPAVRVQPLNTAQGSTALVLVHTAPGTLDDYGPVAASLEPDVPALGIASPLLRASEATPTLVELAVHYADAVGRAMSVPFHLGGAQLGGAIAQEMARALIAAGRHVRSLVMIDSRAPEPSMRSRDVGVAAIARAVVFRELRAGGRTTPVPDLAIDGPIDDDDGGPSALLVDKVRATLQSLDLPGGALDADELRRRIIAMQRHTHAMFHHEPGRIDLPTLLIETTDEAPDHPRPPTLGWDDLASRLSKGRTPGTHFSALGPDHAHELALQLRVWMRGH